jgi:hypothetical protein
MSQNEKQEYFTVIMAHDWRHACIGKVMHGAAGIRTKISGVYASFSVGRMAAPRSVCLFQMCMRVSVLVETSMQQTSIWVHNCAAGYELCRWKQCSPSQTSQ